MKGLFLGSLAALFLTGCVGYHIGPAKPTFMGNVETLAIPTFHNDTLEPRIEVLIAGTVIKQFQQDGTYRIAPESEADAILDGTVTNIRRRSVRSVRGNVLATREFDLDLTLEYVLYRRDTGEVIDKGKEIGSTNFFVSSDLQQDQRQAIPLAAERAAVRIVSRLTEGW